MGVGELAVESRDEAVGHRQVHEREQARLAPEVAGTRVQDVARDAVPARGRALVPESRDLGLLGVPWFIEPSWLLRARISAAAASPMATPLSRATPPGTWAMAAS
jgi:hypothetical protein